MSTPTLRDSQDGPLQKRRKLALVKCERCRLDKQKCLPVERVWPEKCSRCIFKGFPCSEGRRVNRNTKHNAATLATQLPTTGTSTPAEASDPSEFLETLKLRRTLLSYQKIMDMAMRCLVSLKNELVEPFLDEKRPKEYFEKRLSDSAYGEFVTFYNLLEIKISDTTVDLASTIPSPALPLGADVIHELIGQTAPNFLWETECPICYESYDEASLQSLQESKNICGEYLTRLSRVAGHFGVKKYHDHNQTYNLLVVEMKAIDSLIPLVEIEVESKLQDLDVFRKLPVISQSNIHFVPSELCRLMLGLRRYRTDCLGRTSLHQYLDYMGEFRIDHETTIKQILADGNPDLIDKRDILGRTALHIACQRGWLSIMQLLLLHGASVCMYTVCGILPLHYAAARGSLEACKMLLHPDAEYEVDDIYGPSGHSPLSYAIRAKSSEIVGMFLEGEPSYVTNEHIELGIRSNDAAIVRKLLDSSAPSYTQLRDALIEKDVPVQPHQWTMINQYYGYRLENVPVWLPSAGTELDL
ncbi:ankyrin [Periconia macrospinosa]|uniref:Ankyrin n=1 Tax=Periconia macrospinosa TaxID=97972 RepID=A0A2V1E2K7_9PLEO|nr:ankyrin [Periconia macrospinosa]